MKSSVIVLLLSFTCTTCAQDPWSVSKELAQVARKSVIFEWNGELFCEDVKQFIIELDSCNDDFENKLKKIGNTLDRDVKITEEFIIFSCLWKPSFMRNYEMLELWSKQQKRLSNNSIVELQNKSNLVSIQLNNNETLSLRDLSNNKFFHDILPDIPQCFLDTRFIVVCKEIEKKLLIENITDILGGNIVFEEEEIQKIEISAAKIRKRRIQLASEHVKRFSFMHDLIVIESKLESESLPKVPDELLKNLYMHREFDIVLDAHNEKHLQNLLQQLLQLSLSSVPEDRRDKVQIRKDAFPQVWLTGKGKVGGKIELENGTYLHF